MMPVNTLSTSKDLPGEHLYHGIEAETNCTTEGRRVAQAFNVRSYSTTNHSILNLQRLCIQGIPATNDLLKGIEGVSWTDVTGRNSRPKWLGSATFGIAQRLRLSLRSTL